MALLGAAWAWRGRFKAAGATALILCLAALALAPPAAGGNRSLARGSSITVVEARQTSTGLLQVVDLPDRLRRVLLIDGVTQGGMRISSRLSFLQFTENLNYLAWRYHPRARTALLMGLGAGTLARELDARGVAVTVAEIEPQVHALARQWFDLPERVRVVTEDARAVLRRGGARYDLVVLDAFAGENAPWYLCTREAMAEAKASLNPGGRFMANAVCNGTADSPGLRRLEAGVLSAFPEAWGFTTADEGSGTNDLINISLVAGEGLAPAAQGRFPAPLDEGMEPKLLKMEATRRALAPGDAAAGRDDFADMDYADAALRARWRQLVLDDLGADVLGD
jgi:spermidine synthase